VNVEKAASKALYSNEEKVNSDWEGK